MLETWSECMQCVMSFVMSLNSKHEKALGDFFFCSKTYIRQRIRRSTGFQHQVTHQGRWCYFLHPVRVGLRPRSEPFEVVKSGLTPDNERSFVHQELDYLSAASYELSNIGALLQLAAILTVWHISHLTEIGALMALIPPHNNECCSELGHQSKSPTHSYKNTQAGCRKEYFTPSNSLLTHFTERYLGCSARNKV